MTIILATGATGRKLGLPNEELLWGKSIHSCAICDGSSYQNKTVVVVGGGDAAIDAAILLSRHAREVVVIHRREEFRASNHLNLKTLFAISKIDVKKPFVVVEFLLKDDALNLVGIRIRNILTNKTATLSCDGAFIMIGSTPNTQFLKDFVDVNEEGFIATPSGMSDASTGTSVPGVFAAGEVSDNQYKQAITAAAAGARAAIDAERWLRQQLPDASRVQRRVAENIPLQSFSNSGPSVAQEMLDNQVDVFTEQISNIECNDFEKVDCLKASVARHPVVMFSKARCPYCVQALETLKMEGTLQSAIHVFNIDGPHEETIRSHLENMSGRRTVPNIFIGGRNIGGLVLLNRLHKLGELRTILEKANATQMQELASSSATECDDFRRIDCIEAAVRKYPVVVFSKSWCPHCKKALEALSLEGVTGPPHILVVNIDYLDAPSIQSSLAHITGRRTVPNVFIGGHSIGGGDETMRLQGSGALHDLLVNARAIANG
jgi:glutaredoxin